MNLTEKVYSSIHSDLCTYIDLIIIHLVYGCSSDSQYYPLRGCTHYDKANKINTKHFVSSTEFEIDIYLDLEANQLKICLVGELSEDKEVKIWGFEHETKSESGWVPHFNIYWSDTKLRLARIPIEWYGLPKDIEFE